MIILILIVWLHFISDFILQSDKMAINKSKSIDWLSVHSLCYSLPFLIIGWKYTLINGLAHWLVDFCSSKITSYLWQKEERHWFFVTIGADQAIHLTCLLGTLVLLY